MSIYTSLFSNKNKPMSSENKAEFDKLTQQAEVALAAMSEDEKAAEFDRIMGRDLGSKLNDLLALDDPANYDSADSACESIADEFDDLTIEQHADICDTITVWWESHR